MKTPLEVFADIVVKQQIFLLKVRVRDNEVYEFLEAWKTRDLNEYGFRPQDLRRLASVVRGPFQFGPMGEQGQENFEQFIHQYPVAEKGRLTTRMTIVRMFGAVTLDEVVTLAEALAIEFCRKSDVLAPAVAAVSQLGMRHRKLRHLFLVDSDIESENSLWIEAVREVENWIKEISFNRQKFAVVASQNKVDEISRADLLKIYDIKSQGLSYRINEMGHPKPCRTDGTGRKQWFSITEVDAWRKRQQDKS